MAKFTGACVVLCNYLDGALYDLENKTTFATDFIYECIMGLKQLGDYNWTDYLERYKLATGIGVISKKIKDLTMYEFLDNYKYNKDTNNKDVENAYNNLIHMIGENFSNAEKFWNVKDHNAFRAIENIEYKVIE